MFVAMSLYSLVGRCDAVDGRSCVGVINGSPVFEQKSVLLKSSSEEGRTFWPKGLSLFDRQLCFWLSSGLR